MNEPLLPAITEMSNISPQFVTSQLIGHKKAVTCLIMHPTDSDCLLSGSDDKTVRLWDIRTNRSNKCIGGCFPEAIESLAFVDDKFLCVASGMTLLSFDIRFEGILQRTPLSVLSEGFEDINRIIPHPHPKERTLAVADDSGDITLIPITVEGLFPSCHLKKLSKVHTNIVGAIAYKPNNKNELISGGYDCVVCTWDISRGKATSSVRVEHILEEGDEKPTNQLLNPPFIQSVAYCCEGRGVLLSLGDGTLRLLSSKDLRTVHSVTAHRSMLTAMHVENDLVMTGGVDCCVNAWRINEPVFDETQITSNSSSSSKGKKGKLKGPSRPEFDARIEKLFAIEHGNKIESILFDKTTTSTNYNRFFVTDVTKDITVYQVRG